MASMSNRNTATMTEVVVDFPEGGSRPQSVAVSSTTDEKQLSSATSVPSMTVSLAWKDLSYTITHPKTKEKVNIIDKVSGIVMPGEVLAIMGPSGAGKTTLLDLLAGAKNPEHVTGDVYLNGHPDSRVKYCSTYVMQEDALTGVLTVRENIKFAADLCLPSSYTKAQRNAAVQNIIEEFGLERVADNKIGSLFVRGVSGGEKRRASIASQLLTNPKIIFLDEPTTGLDSAAAYNVMKVIVDMARKHHLTVIASIHQPSTEIYMLFDKLCLVSRGRTVFYGTREHVLEYFEKLGWGCPSHANPADHFLRIINTDFLIEEFSDKSEAEKHVDGFIEAYDNSEAKARLSEEINELTTQAAKGRGPPKVNSSTTKRYETNFLRQTWVLTVRNVKQSIRNPLVLGGRLVSYAFLGILMGTAWWQIGDDVYDRLSALFFAVAFLTFMSVSGVPVFIEDRAVFLRDRANGYYRVGAYCFSSFIVSLPVILAATLAFTVIAYPMVGLSGGADTVLRFIVFLFLALNVSEAWAIFISVCIPVFVAALAIYAFVQGLFFMMQGFFIRRADIRKGWIWVHWIDYQKYAFEALLANEVDGQTFQCDRVQTSDGEVCHCRYGDPSGKSCSFTGQDVLNDLRYDDVKFWLWGLATVASVLVMRFAIYLVLRSKRSRH